MRNEQEMSDLILNVAKDDPRVIAVLLNGSRANPNAPKDKYQDFDIVYVVTEIDTWLADNHWIDIFGKRVMLQMPETMRNPGNDGTFTYLMLFEEGYRIDLTLMPIGKLNMSDKMTIVLLDKENRFTNCEPSSDRDYHVKMPSHLEYTSCCNNFLWCLQNVAKGIARDELPYAMGMFDLVVREELNHMTGWYIGTLTDFSVSSGKMGKYFKRYLPQDVYQMIKETYSDSNYEHLWKSVFIAIKCFKMMAITVGDKTGYSYNHQDHQKMVNYLLDFKKDLNGEQKMEKGIENYLDDQGRIKQWPSKMNMKYKVLEYVLTKFEDDKEYTETQVNEILKQWHTFNDYFVLRRGLIDAGYLKRHVDGSQYWKSHDKTELDKLVIDSADEDPR